MNILKQITRRLTSPTPNFWKKVIRFGLTLTAISTGLLLAPEGIELPPIVQKIAGYFATAGFVATVIGKATTTDHELSNK